MSFPELSVLIPAAGESKRLGQAKQLLQYGSGSLIQNTVNTAQALAPGEIVMVTGAQSTAVKASVQHHPVLWVHNSHWSDGMGGSIALGTAAVNPGSTGLMILLCDQWRIRLQDLLALANCWRSDPGRIFVAEADGHYMPPVIFPSTCFKAILQLKGQQGARSVLDTYAELVTPVSMANAAFDLDTQEQLLEMKKTQS
jgi:molybdenum cofactor cytidylyltransferase